MKTAKLKIDNFNGGWINDFTKPAYSVPQTKKNTYHTGMASFTRPGYLGKISSPINANSSASYSVQSSYGMPIDATVDSLGRGYFITTKGYILQSIITSGGLTTPVNYTAVSATSVDNEFKACWMHTTAAGVESVFFTYSTASNDYFGYMDTSGTTVGTALTFTTRSVPHVGCVSVGNKSYMTDGNYIRTYDPNSVTPFGVSLDIGKGWIARSVCDYGNYVAIVANKGETQARLIMWDGSSQFQNYQYDIRDSYVSAVVNEGNTLRCITRGKNGTIKIKSFSNGFDEEADFEFPINAFGIDSYLMPSHQQVDVWMNQIIFRVGEGIYTYGSPKKNEITSGFHKIGTLTSDANYRYGCLRNLIQDTCYYGSKVSGQDYLAYFTSDGLQQAGTIQSARYRLPHKSTINRFMVYFDKYRLFTSGTNDSLTFSIYKDLSTTPIHIEVFPSSTTEDTILYEHPIQQSIENIDEFYFEMEFLGCVISRVDVYYSYDENEL